MEIVVVDNNLVIVVVLERGALLLLPMEHQLAHALYERAAALKGATKNRC